jgi:hypothetical protein
VDNISGRVLCRPIGRRMSPGHTRLLIDFLGQCRRQVARMSVATCGVLRGKTPDIASLIRATVTGSSAFADHDKNCQCRKAYPGFRFTQFGLRVSLSRLYSPTESVNSFRVIAARPRRTAAQASGMAARGRGRAERNLSNSRKKTTGFARAQPILPL